MIKIKAIIIEDEEPARNLVKNFLLPHSEIELAGEFADGFSGIKAINELKPDLVFLDIQMPKLTGFEILDLVETKPLIIFTTAYDQYAIKAFEANATDYLLKPFTRERFSQAVIKAIDKFHHKLTDDVKVKSIISTMDQKSETIERVAVKTAGRIHVIPSDSILYLEAEDDYVMIHTKDGRYLKEKTMKYFETHLDKAVFVRIHRSFIANVNEILRIDHYDKENYMVILKNKAELKASSAGYKLLKQMLNL